MEPRTRLFVSLLLLLAAVLEASPQTASSAPLANQAAVRKTGKAGSSRSSPARNSIAAPSPGLCFQPGIGWQPSLTGQPGGSATQPASVSAYGAVNPPSVDAKSMSAKQAHPGESAGILSDQKKLGAGAETSAIVSPNRATRSAALTKHRAVTSLQVTPLHPDGNPGLNLMRTTPSAMPSAPMHFATDAGPDEYSDLVGEHAFRAYISSIKLRRLIRNAPDFRRRIKLEQLQNNPATKLHHARVDRKTRQVAGTPLQGERVDATSLRRSDANGRPRSKPRD
jgi:hypothetical protein